MADIKTFKDNETQVLPRTTSAAVMNDNGEPIENDINSISVPVESAANTLNAVTGTFSDRIAQSLNELQNIKEDLKSALAEKGQTVSDVFSTYPAAVRSIETGPELRNVSLSISGSGYSSFSYSYLSDNSEIVSIVKGTISDDKVLLNSVVTVYANMVPRFSGAEYIGLIGINRAFRIIGDASFNFLTPP